jgi:hypothetical protein
MDERNDELRYERLVDGELTREDYRALVAALEEEPGGWRRCAMAFLEHQALARELGGLGDSPGAVPRAATMPSAGGKRILPMLLAMAASFLVAFGLGAFAPRFFSMARQDLTLAGNVSVERSPGVEGAAGGDYVHRTLRPVGNLRLLVDGSSGETAERGQVPVYEAAGEIEQLLAAEGPVLKPELIELLRQRGYEVHYEQQYFPAPTDDGRQIIVPVDGYQITPVSVRY